MIYPSLDLHIISLLAGLWLIISHGVALLKPGMVQAWARKFPRSKPAGLLLIAIDAIWAMVMVATMDLGEFSSYRMMLMGAVAVATFLTVRYVDEFLSVRALGILLLLIAEPLIEAAFLKPQEGRLLLVVLAYVLAIFGMIWVGMPYKLRDQIDWARKSKAVWFAGALAGVVYGGLLAGFGLIK